MFYYSVVGSRCYPSFRVSVAARLLVDGRHQLSLHMKISPTSSFWEIHHASCTDQSIDDETPRTNDRRPNSHRPLVVVDAHPTPVLSCKTLVSHPSMTSKWISFWIHRVLDFFDSFLIFQSSFDDDLNSLVYAPDWNKYTDEDDVDDGVTDKEKTLIYPFHSSSVQVGPLWHVERVSWRSSHLNTKDQQSSRRNNKKRNASTGTEWCD